MEEQAKEEVKAKMEAKGEMEEDVEDRKEKQNFFHWYSVEERKERQIFFSLISLLLKTISSQIIDQLFQKEKNFNKKYPKVGHKIFQLFLKEYLPNVANTKAHSRNEDPYYCQNLQFSELKQDNFWPCQNIPTRYTERVLCDFLQNHFISPYLLMKPL